MDVEIEKFLTDLDEIVLMKIPNNPDYQVIRNAIHYLLLIEVEEVPE